MSGTARDANPQTMNGSTISRRLIERAQRGPLSEQSHPLGRRGGLETVSLVGVAHPDSPTDGDEFDDQPPADRTRGSITQPAFFTRPKL